MSAGGEVGAVGAVAPRWIGRTLIAVGAWHTAFGVWWFAAPLAEAVRAGGWNAVGWSPGRRPLAFWFLVVGAVVLLLGVLVNDVELQRRPIRRSVGWALVALAVVGGAAVPISGFWVLLAPGLGLLLRAPARRA